MTPAVRTEVGRWGGVRRIATGGPGWLRVAVVVGVLALAFVAAQTCQQSQIRVTKEEAIAKATARIPFEPRRTQVRLLRQGFAAEPFWIISLSVPGESEDEFRELAVVRVDANSGEVADVKVQR